MKTPEEIYQQWKTAQSKYRPNDTIGPTLEELKAAYRIWMMMKTPQGLVEIYGDKVDVSKGWPDYHPDKWNERTLLMIAGCIQYENA